MAKQFWVMEFLLIQHFYRWSLKYKKVLFFSNSLLDGNIFYRPSNEQIVTGQVFSKKIGITSHIYIQKFEEHKAWWLGIGRVPYWGLFLTFIGSFGLMWTLWMSEMTRRIPQPGFGPRGPKCFSQISLLLFKKCQNITVYLFENRQLSGYSANFPQN